MLKLNIDKKVYPNGYQALWEMKLEFPSRGLFAIIGESGSGKSTLLNCISGIDNFDGELIFDGVLIKKRKDVEKYRRQTVSAIFQDFRLAQELNVGENVTLASNIVGKKLTDEQVGNMLKSVGLPEKYSVKSVNELSYGEMQRVAIARAIAKDAKIIVADEPTANLDSQNADGIMALLKEIANTSLVIVVSHNEELVKKFCDGYVELSDGEAVKNTVICSDADSHIASERSVGKTNFSLISKLIMRQSKVGFKNIALIIVSIIFMFLSAMGIIISQVSIEKAMTYTLKSNDKSDMTVYVRLYDGNNEEVLNIPSESVGEQIGFSDLDIDIFSMSEYDEYLTSVDDKEIYFGNSIMRIERAIYVDSLYKTGLSLLAGSDRVEDNQVIIPSAIADVIINLGETTSVFAQKKQVGSYDDLLGCEFSCSYLYGKSVKIIGIYQSSTKYFVSYEEYKKLNEKERYEYVQKCVEIFHYNSIIMSKSVMGESVDGIALDYKNMGARIFEVSAEFIYKTSATQARYSFINSEDLYNMVYSISSVKYYLTIPLTALMLGLMVLTAYISLSSMISRNREGTLTLRALGMTSNTIAGIYLFSTVALTLVEFLITLIFSCAGAPIVNAIIRSFNSKYHFTVLGLTALSQIVPIAILLVSNVLVAYISVMKLFRKSVETQVKEV